MTIDWTKPVQTRDGREVRIAAERMPEAVFSVVGWQRETDGSWTGSSWAADGRYYVLPDAHAKTDYRDLINVPEAPKRFEYELWALVFNNGTTYLYQNEQIARGQARSYMENLIAIKRVVIAGTEGDGV